VVIQVAPTLFCSPAALVFAKLTKARSVLHIQDFEVDAMFGLDMAGGGALKGLAYAFERSMLTHFDLVSTISQGMIKRAVAKGVDPQKTILFPNWSEIERFQDIVVNDEFIASLGVDRRKKLVLYSGSMGEKQGLGSVLEVASRFQERDDIQFLLVGEGGVKSDLVEECERLQLKNVSFAPLQPYDALPMLLAAADCHLVVQKRGAADAMLPSKLTNILAAGGNAVITADPDTSLGELVREWPGIACCVEPESVDALSSGIEQTLAMPSPNSIALEYAGEHLEKNAVLATFLSRFDDLVESTKVQDVR
jgi:colanic acid biosynthesis glycosyl transferase WcaI